jgi:hypothetical protein
MEHKQRCEPRYPFIAAAELLEENSGARMSSQISDLSLNGCYVDTINPLPDGTLVHVRIFTETRAFEAPATVIRSSGVSGNGSQVSQGAARIRGGPAALAAGARGAGR